MPKSCKSKSQATPYEKPSKAPKKKRSTKHADDILKFELDFVYQDMVLNITAPSTAPSIDSEAELLIQEQKKKVEEDFDDTLLKLSAL